jgi:streptomycin 6-kinase
VIAVPREFADDLVRTHGEAARRWIAAVPGLVGELCGRWGVELDEGEPPRGDLNLVFLARRGDEPCVLKLCWPTGSAADESRALEAWDGRGAVRLLEAASDDGALLLERLDSRRSLASLELRSAAEVAGGLIRQLAIPAPPGLPRLADAASEIAETVRPRQEALGSPVPARWADLAVRLAGDLAAGAGTALVHGDLHYGNVLAGTRQPWLAIDPKPVAGDPERYVPELMWDRANEAKDAAGIHELLAVLVHAGGLDPGRARAWTIVRAVDYWLWGLDAGLTRDPLRCHRLLEALLT